MSILWVKNWCHITLICYNKYRVGQCLCDCCLKRLPRPSDTSSCCASGHIRPWTCWGKHNPSLTEASCWHEQKAWLIRTQCLHGELPILSTSVVVYFRPTQERGWNSIEDRLIKLSTALVSMSQQSIVWSVIAWVSSYSFIRGVRHQLM